MVHKIQEHVKNIVFTFIQQYKIITALLILVREMIMKKTFTYMIFIFKVYIYAESNQSSVEWKGHVYQYPGVDQRGHVVCGTNTFVNT